MELYLRGMLTGMFFGAWAGGVFVMLAINDPDGWLSILSALAGVALFAFLQYKWAQRHVIPKGSTA